MNSIQLCKCGGTVENVPSINQLSLPVPKIKILSALWLSYFKSSSPELVTVKRCGIANKVSPSSGIGGYAAWVPRCLLTPRRIVSILGSFARTSSVTPAMFAAMMLLVDAFVSMAARFIFFYYYFFNFFYIGNHINIFYKIFTLQ